MRFRLAVVPVVVAGLLSASAAVGCGGDSRLDVVRPPAATTIALPGPRLTGPLSLEQALAARHSVREFRPRPLTVRELAQLLWAAQGQTRAGGGRTAPSAGAKYPLEVYAVANGLVLHYLPAGHRAQEWHRPGLIAQLGGAALGQDSVARAPAVVVVTVAPSRSRAKYGPRGDRYADLEAGHAAQNVLLEAVALGLGGVPVGAFDDGRVADLLPLGPGEFPRYLIAVGVPAPGR